jgi:hypothetical protein
MEREPYREPSQLTGIHINLDEQAIEFEDRHGTIGRLVFGRETVLYEGQPLLLVPTDDPRTDSEAAEQRARAAQAPRPSATPHSVHTPSPRTPREQG